MKSCLLLFLPLFTFVDAMFAGESLFTGESASVE